MTDKEVIIRLLKTTAQVEEKLNAALKPFELSAPQFNVLRILRGSQDRPAHLSTLQEKMIKPMSNTTRLVDKLVVKDLVHRTLCANNRRKVDICITDKGLALLDHLDRAIDTAEAALVESLSPNERLLLHDLLQKMIS